MSLSVGSGRLVEIFKLHRPKGPAAPIVANLPHSGLFVPDDIAAQFTQTHLQTLPHSDWRLDKLYQDLPQLGITVLQATHSRYVVDLNRPLKPPLFGSFWTSVVPRRTAMGQQIYQIEPSRASIQARIETYYQPYHHQLNTLIEETYNTFGRVYLLDLHSFMGPIQEDVCLGNRNGKTCSERLISAVEKPFADQGYQVVRNKQFNGGYITAHYGQMPNVEALQIEVRYPVYLAKHQLDVPLIPDWDVPELAAARPIFTQIFSTIAKALGSPPANRA
ncbi:MAG: N-formylglutamate amidohydrolase [Leptolyngbyaceae cyanobacterium MO_188.B28]|nr:N-formylglutamate amidohydrolase [Leptolyngbyaceae cyanobacterium MO_188.B28]